MNPGVEERVRFWMANAEIAAVALKKVSPSGDYTNLVVVIADMRDSIARMIVEAAGQTLKLDVAGHEAKTEQKGEIPTAFMILKVEVAAKLFEIVEHPGITQNLAKVPPPGRVRGIVIAAEGAMLIHPPVVALPEGGQS